ncbi:hypothetical protein BEI_2558 [Halomonas beimenensis]|uniref:Uncharacterized protein n=1 Tax=Halomonas beimenensis TaxID=475662 RepID=A0A291P9J1_9GAMM|nr:hypothetical protein BEI_2558 [Halomonas beimenensis]
MIPVAGDDATAGRSAPEANAVTLSLGANPSTGLRGGAVNPSLGATDAIHGVGPPLRPVPGASLRNQR